MKNQIRPQFPTPRSIGYGAGYLIAEPADHRTVPLPGHGCHRKYLPGISRSIFREYFDTRGILQPLPAGIVM